MYHSLSFKPNGKEIAKVFKKSTDPETGKIKYEKTKKALYLLSSDTAFPQTQRRVELSNKSNEVFLPSYVNQEGDYPNRMFFGGGSLCGKSYLASKVAEDYNKKHKNNKVILFSGIDNDDYKKIKNFHRIRIDDSLLENPMTLEELHDALVIFDDIHVVPDKELRNELCHIRDKCVNAGRHRNTSTMVLQQQLLGGNDTKSSLNGCFQIVGYPRSTSKHQLHNYLHRYLNLPKDETEKIMKKDSRWVVMNNTNPMYVLSEKDCELT